MLTRRVLRSSLIRPSTFARAFSRTSVRLNDDVLKRYQDKLHQRAKAEGLESVDDLKSKYQDEIKKVREKYDKIDPLKHLDPEASAASAEMSKDRGRRPDIPDEEKVKDLATFVDVAKLSMHPSKEIEMIWKARFASQENSICGALDGITFSRIYRNARRFPRFILPLPHEEGAELHFVQWAFPAPYTMHCMFTSLAEFKLHQEYARPHTTMAIHSDLLADKELALMNGSVEKDSSLNQAHGAFLAANIQRFYGADESAESGLRKLALLEAFNIGSSEFSPERLMAEVETLD